MVFNLSNGIVSDENIRCLGVDKAADAPSGWTTQDFDDTTWQSAKA